MAVELTTVPTETTVDPAADYFFMNDVSETPDALNKVTVDSIFAAIDASTTEVLTGTGTTTAATPNAIAALWEQGADVASAGTVSLGEGGYFNITGTTTITDIDFATDKAGRKAWVKFAGILTLTHNATTLILPTGANITTAAGDTACFVSEGTDNVRCVAYQRASGAALVGGGIAGSTGSTDNAILRADGTGGATAQSSLMTIDDDGHPTIPANAGNHALIYLNTASNDGYIDAYAYGGLSIGSDGGVFFTDSNGYPIYGSIDSSGLYIDSGYLELDEQTAPAAPAANKVRIYAVDNGAGKTQLMALFGSGAAQQLAIEP